MPIQRDNHSVDPIWAWAATVDWSALVVDVGIPVAAILVPTLIAVRLARNERERAEEDRRAARVEREKERLAAAEARATERLERYRDRRREAGAGVIVSLARLISIYPSDPSMQSVFADFRGHIGVYRAWVEPEEDHSGDWLALQHAKGTWVWSAAMGEIAAKGGINRTADHELIDIMEPARRWAQDAIDTFSAWLAGDLDQQVLRTQGAEIIAAQKAGHEAD